MEARNEHCRASATGSSDLPGRSVGVGVHLIEHADDAFASCHIESFASSVVEQVIRVAGAIELRRPLPRPCVKDEQLGRAAAANKEPIVCFIKSHWEVRLGIRDLPLVDYGTSLPVNHCDVACGWHVDENATALGLKLKRLGMS